MKRSIVNSLLVAIFLVINSCRPMPKEYIDLPGLTSSGDDWKLYAQHIGDGEGHLKMHQDKWLMYFLHWRPLTPQNRLLTPESVREHMLNFWGPNMNFQLREITGEMTINGHRALFVEGTLANHSVKSRFIVWNCPKTNRQFTADCNINRRRGTPEELLELQRRITETVRCHEGSPPEPAGVLTQRYESSRWNLSFLLPGNWRTADFPYEEWFPNGMTRQNGSLWSLLTDSEKHLELIWHKSNEEPSADLFRQFLDEIVSSPPDKPKQPTILDFQLDSIEQKGDYFVGTGSYRYRQPGRKRSRTLEYRFKGVLWKNEEEVFFLIAGLVVLKEFWGIPVDLKPSPDTLERFLKEEVIPNIRVMKKDEFVGIAL